MSQDSFLNFYVTVVQGRGLGGSSRKGVSSCIVLSYPFTGSISPYVTIEIKKWMIEVKGRKQQKGKTPVVKHSSEPVWEAADRTTFTLYDNLQHVTHPLVILWT